MCVFLTFSYDVIFLGDLSAIVGRFLDTGARVLFSAEAYCWPDKSLAAHYPPVSRGKRYLNSGGFIGYASDIYKILDTTPIKDDDDDQLFYTTVYLQDELRMRYKIKLDHKSEIFQNLFGATGKGKWNLRGESVDIWCLNYRCCSSQPTWSSGLRARKLIFRISSTIRCPWCFTATGSAS